MLFIHNTWAQPMHDTGKPPLANTAIKPYAADKNKVLDYFQNQQFEEAIDYLQPAFTADSTNITTLAWLGYASYMNDEKPAAEKYYEHIFRLDTNNISALSYLVALNKEDAHVIAMEYTTRLLALQPGKAFWWRTMGELFRRTNELDSAVAYYYHAHALAPTDSKAIVGLGDALIDKKSYREHGCSYTGTRAKSAQFIYLCSSWWALQKSPILTIYTFRYPLEWFL